MNELQPHASQSAKDFYTVVHPYLVDHVKTPLKQLETEDVYRLNNKGYETDVSVH